MGGATICSSHIINHTTKHRPAGGFVCAARTSRRRSEARSKIRCAVVDQRRRRGSFLQSEEYRFLRLKPSFRVLVLSFASNPEDVASLSDRYGDDGSGQTSLNSRQISYRAREIKISGWKCTQTQIVGNLIWRWWSDLAAGRWFWLDDDWIILDRN